MSIEHVTRVEGHGNNSLQHEGEQSGGDQVGGARGPALFEAMVKGHSWKEVPS